MPLFLVVPEIDAGDIAALDLPCALRPLRREKDGFSPDPVGLTADTLALVSLSPAGRDMLSALAADWAVRTGSAPPPSIDLAAAADPQGAALAHLAPLLARREAEASAHAAELLDSLAALRLAHEAAARQLRTLNVFIEGALDKTRWLAQANGPLPNTRAPHLEIPPHTPALQRLSASSLGLSDLAIFLPPQEIPDAARLQARLRLSESGEVLADWDIPAAEITPGGWLRLSLVETAGDDEQTPELILTWSGPVPLRIGGSMFHPEPDLCLSIGETRTTRLLAHRVWKYAPATRPALPEDGHTPQPVAAGRSYVDPTRLAAAANAANADLRYFPDLKALQVHPREGRESAARLTRAVRPGMRRISAEIGGRHAAGPAIEYALAAMPPAPARELPDLLAEAARQRRLSDWTTCAGDRRDRLTLILPDPAGEPLDLWLLTRLAPEARPAYAWATFGDIRLSA